jgi:hypothetical protein
MGRGWEGGRGEKSGGMLAEGATAGKVKHESHGRLSLYPLLHPSLSLPLKGRGPDHHSTRRGRDGPARVGR